MSQQTLVAWHRFTITMTALVVVGIGLTKLAPAQQTQPRQLQTTAPVYQTPSPANVSLPPSGVGRFAMVVTPLQYQENRGVIESYVYILDTKTGQVWRNSNNSSGPLIVADSSR